MYCIGIQKFYIFQSESREGQDLSRGDRASLGPPVATGLDNPSALKSCRALTLAVCYHMDAYHYDIHAYIDRQEDTAYT